MVRLLRITTDSPAVEATSTRCQAVLEAFRGRAAAARRMIDSARRTVTELGLRHALLEVEQFAGIVELVMDDPAAAEPHLRQAYNGFRRMGLDADTAETAALLGRTCLALDREDEADELCTESEHLAGNALKASIAWRTLRAKLLSRRGAHDEARHVAEAAVNRAERTDALVDHGDACLALATVLDAAGDARGARAAAERAVDLYERKGAAALADKARCILGTADLRQPPQLEAGPVEPTNSCAQAGSRLVDAVNREAWDEVAQLLAPSVSVESRRKIVGFARMDVPSSQWPQDMSRYLEAGMVRYRQTALAVRGDRFALFRLELGTADLSSGAPQDEMLQVAGLDDEGRIALQVKFDVEDIDAALAELDAQHNAATPTEAVSVEPDNACARMVRRVTAAIERGAWDEFEELFTPHPVESRRKIVGFTRDDFSISEFRRMVESHALQPRNNPVIAVRGERLALCRIEIGTDDVSPGAPHDEMLQLIGLGEDGRVALEVFFDIEDVDAAIEELDAAHARFEAAPQQAPRLANAASCVAVRFWSYFATRDWDAITEVLADDVSADDRRRTANAGVRHGRQAEVESLKAAADVGFANLTPTVIAARGERLILSRTQASGRDPEAIRGEVLHLIEIDADQRIVALVVFELDDLEAAIAELDARYLAGEAAAHAHTWLTVTGCYAALNRREMPATTTDFVNIDHRRVTPFAPGDVKAYTRAAWNQIPDISYRIETVHRLSDLGTVISHTVGGTSRDGVEAEWREVLLVTFEGDLINRNELFDESNLDNAIVKFDQLNRPAPQLENAASQVIGRFLVCFAVRDWDTFAEILADDIYTEDRRRVVNAGIRQDRDAEIKDFRSAADLGVTNATSDVIATRGERLVLIRSRLSRSDEEPESFHVELLWVVEIDADDRIAAWVTFDPDDFSAAIAELDERYLPGEAAANSQTWSVITKAYAELNRQKLPATTPDFQDIDHRHAAPFAPGDLFEYLQAAWDLGVDVKMHIDTVHQLSDFGAVITHTAQGTSQEGSDVEWREINLLTIDGERFTRCELFDEADIDAALARFTELHPQAPRLKNAATRVCQRLHACFAAREWDALAEILADDVSTDDRRRVVGEGIRLGREAVIAEISTLSALGVKNATSEFIAIRGSHVVLRRFCTWGRAQRPEEFHTAVLDVIEINADERIAARVVFDLDDFDAAIAELDARYLAGEAADHAHTWSLIAGAFAAINRHELPELTPDWVNVDHRRGAAFATGNMTAYLNDLLDDTPDINVYIEVVHRLSNLGAVIAQAAHGTSQQGFQAEWREIGIFTFDGDLLSRYELFDEADLDAALARFDKLSRPAPQLENAATQVADRFLAHFAAGDWDAMVETLADNLSSDDRRRVVGAGVQHGRDIQIEAMRVIADVSLTKVTTTYMATRGERLALARSRFTDRDQGNESFLTEALCIVEIDADMRILALVSFDIADFEAALAELDARYLAGEAAAHSHMWSAVLGAYAAINGRELPATTPDFESIDHRRGAAFASGDMIEYLRAGWDLDQDIYFHIEAVHRLSDLGAVATHRGRGTSREGFDAEWREVMLFTSDGDSFSRCEVFDDSDIDAALARFDELHAHTRRLKNVVAERFLAQFAARDWDAMAQLFADDYYCDDRRRVVNAGVRRGRNAAIEDLRVAADVGLLTNVTSTVIAARGERLILTRFRASGRETDAVQVDVLQVVEHDAHERIAAAVVFDLDDIEAATAELDARYLAGEAADHAQTWSAVTRGFAALNRRELPPTTPDWVNIDHRRGTSFAPGEMPALLGAAWNRISDLSNFIETVHRLNNLGAVITHMAHETTQDGFHAEWRVISVLTLEGDKFNRCEVYDDTDLDAALARFEELQPQTPRLENTASQVGERYRAHFAAGNWDAMADIIADDFFSDDRRRVVGSGVRIGREAQIADMRAIADLFIANMTWTDIATRGDRLVLFRVGFLDRDQKPDAFRTEVLCVAEIDADERIVASVSFDLDDIDAAFEELDARYLAGEAAAHARTWSVITGTYAAVNRHEVPATTPDWAMVDHRPIGAFEAADLAAFLDATWALTAQASIYIEAVHRLNDIGAVVTHASHATSQEGLRGRVARHQPCDRRRGSGRPLRDIRPGRQRRRRLPALRN